MFVCLVVVRTGSVHDSLAYKLSEFSSKIQAGKLPCGSFLNGDDAYACSDHMVTPYHGRKRVLTEMVLITGKVKCGLILNVHSAFCMRGGVYYGGLFSLLLIRCQ